jgi:hypothetical protein
MFSDSTHSPKGFRAPDSSRGLDIAVLGPTPFKFVRIELSLYALTVSIVITDSTTTFQNVASADSSGVGGPNKEPLILYE